jgi:hypothetical protein
VREEGEQGGERGNGPDRRHPRPRCSHVAHRDARIHR